MATIDEKIAQVANDFKLGLPFLSNIYGRAYKFKSLANKKTIVKPIIVVDGLMKTIQPDDKEKGILFFYIKDRVQAIDYDPIKDNQYRYNVDMIIWLNSSKFFTEHLVQEGIGDNAVIKTIKTYNWKGLEYYLSKLKEVLKQIPAYSVDTISYEAENIWSEFTIEEERRQYFTHPFYGARISGRWITYENEC